MFMTEKNQNSYWRHRIFITSVLIVANVQQMPSIEQSKDGITSTRPVSLGAATTMDVSAKSSHWRLSTSE